LRIARAVDARDGLPTRDNAYATARQVTIRPGRQRVGIGVSSSFAVARPKAYRSPPAKCPSTARRSRTTRGRSIGRRAGAVVVAGVPAPGGRAPTRIHASVTAISVSKECAEESLRDEIVEPLLVACSPPSRGLIRSTGRNDRVMIVDLRVVDDAPAGAG
jgi:hypothetical protein